MFLSLVDLQFEPAAIPDWTIDVETLCLNRDLPHALPYSDGHPTMQLVEGGPDQDRSPHPAHAHAEA